MGHIQWTYQHDCIRDDEPLKEAAAKNAIAVLIETLWTAPKSFMLLLYNAAHSASSIQLFPVWKVDRVVVIIYALFSL